MGQKQMIIFILTVILSFQVTSLFAKSGLKEIKELQLNWQHGKNTSNIEHIEEDPTDTTKEQENQDQDSANSERRVTDIYLRTSYSDIVKGGISNPKYVPTSIFTREDLKQAGITLAAGIITVVVVTAIITTIPEQVFVGCVTGLFAGVIYIKNNGDQFFIPKENLNRHEDMIYSEESNDICP